MKNMVVLALISLLLVGGMVLMSCNNNPACSGNGRCDRKSVWVFGAFENCYIMSTIISEDDCLPRSASECACR